MEKEILSLIKEFPALPEAVAVCLDDVKPTEELVQFQTKTATILSRLLPLVQQLRAENVDMSIWKRLGPTLVDACACYVNPLAPWFAENCAENARAILELLTTHQVDQLFSQLVSRWQESNHDADPRCLFSFFWCVKSISPNKLADALLFFNPLLLRAIDTYKVPVRAAGLGALHHVIETVTATQLRTTGLALVYYDALLPILHMREPVLIRAIAAPMAALLPVLEWAPACGSTTRHDEVLRIALRGAELEGRIGARRAHVHALACYVKASGIVTVKHMRAILRILREYADGTDDEVHCGVVSLLHALVCHAWPRIPPHRAECEAILNACEVCRVTFTQHSHAHSTSVDSLLSFNIPLHPHPHRSQPRLLQLPSPLQCCLQTSTRPPRESAADRAFHWTLRLMVVSN
eukprot:m.49977 g.49977  ORF g.49977 m.49977 type:complete len:407 (-) comp11539_c0_seq1:126-1346(-)